MDFVDRKKELGRLETALRDAKASFRLSMGAGGRASPSAHPVAKARGNQSAAKTEIQLLAVDAPARCSDEGVSNLKTTFLLIEQIIIKEPYHSYHS